MDVGVDGDQCVAARVRHLKPAVYSNESILPQHHLRNDFRLHDRLETPLNNI